MEDQIVDLVVAVDQRGAISRPRPRILEKGHQVVEMRDLADRLVRLDVDGLRLRGRNGAEGRDLAVVEAGRFAEAG